MFERQAAHPEPPVLDAAYLARLRALLGDPVLDELLEDGLIELADRMARLRDLRRAEDFEGLARLGHDLVGMAGHLGLAALSAAAAGLNRAARDGAACDGAAGGAAAGAAEAASDRAHAAGLAAERALRAHLGKESAT